MTQAAVVAAYGSNSPSNRNKIINGAMVVDQRNGGAAVTPTTNTTYTLDRWLTYLSQASKFSVQQSTVVPAGFKNSLLVTSLSAYAVGTSETFSIVQRIEGLNIYDLDWGTADAKTVTLSFWTRSSLTGTFGGTIKNSAEDRVYPFSYTISTANTWEKVTITIEGDTSGTWLTTNGRGITVVFGLGTGATFSATAGAWSAGNKFSATGATSVVGTLNATWYVTGVQLEKGSTATDFEYVDYGRQLQQCQRYAFATNGSNGIGGVGDTTSRGQQFIVPEMRATPTLTTLTAGSVNMTDGYSANPNAANATFTLSYINPDFARVNIGGFSGLTSGRWMSGIGNGTAVILFSAEL
tara:strand:+ start:1364 stop:2419 length:1056 start_codon:yes stop_codon:yes gene_type:complete